MLFFTNAMLCGWASINSWVVKRKFQKKFFLLLIVTFIMIISVIVRIPRTYWSIPKPRPAPDTCPFWISEETITPLNYTKHLLVSAYMDQRVRGFDIRIIGIFRRDSIQPLYCIFCCAGQISTATTTTILQHSHSFGFPFVATDVMCELPQNCSATHVCLVTHPDRIRVNVAWLPMRNLRNGKEETKLLFNFTVCVSNLFGDYNNVLQFAQTLEMYRLLGVDRVVIYNTSCGPELNRLLQSYSEEGFVEMVPWPINQHLKPSHGWLFSKHGGDVHYFGQLATLNECIYRSMDRSRYVLLNDIDEIIMPYQHDSLMSLMNMLQQQHPDVGMVEQTSVHEVLKRFGKQYKVPLDVCRIIHVRKALRATLTLKQLNEDKRLWSFSDKLIPRVDRALERAGLLGSKGQS